MTREEKIICKDFLNDADKTHSCNEYKLLMALLEQEPILDKIRAEIKAKIEEEEFARSVFRHEEKDTAKAEQCTGSIMAYNNMIKLIDKYKAESGVEDADSN